MSPAAAPRVVAVDLGKTRCRVRIDDRDDDGSRSGHGAPGLASPLGAEHAYDAIAPLLGDLPPTAVDAIGIGAAGAESAPAAARLLASRVAERWSAPTVVASDVLTAHLGALGGRPGTVLIAGTGSVALRIDDAGERQRSDGWGPWLGDDGSGRWIGQHGLQAALRAADGRGEPTGLVEDASRLAGTLEALPTLLGGADTARTLASFAPAVLARASGGDDVATRIVSDAADLLARTAASISPSGADVAVIGGLADAPAFLTLLTAALHARGLTPLRPLGTALDGAAALAVRSDLPHERYAIRV